MITASAVGKRIQIAGGWRTVIRVADDIETERPSTDPPEAVCAPFEQMLLRGAPSLRMRTRDDAGGVVSELRHGVRDVEAVVSVTR